TEHLFASIIYFNAGALEQLISSGIDIRLISPLGDDAMSAAANARNVEAVRRLHALGLDVDQAPAGGKRPIFFALAAESEMYKETGEWNPDEVLCSDCLIELGADLGLRGNETETPLDYARRWEHPKYSLKGGS
ncbi:MAG TPA: ankyrin repeat domain-containing protein, partial [Candidatus Limnocylindria bacterium]|nr:ankyrin repeat domain-containing protein [Candidatus Limnocylindria bacterium]